MGWNVYDAQGRAKTIPADLTPGWVSTPIPSAQAYRNANLSVPSGAITVIPLPNESWDTDGIHDNSTNPSRMTCRTPGLYLVSAFMIAGSNTTGVRYTYILKNGGVVSQTGLNIGSAGHSSNMAEVVNLAVGDYVEFGIWQNGASPLADAVYTARMEMTYLGPTFQTVPQGTLVSSLPSSPVDGQEVRYLADATNGVVWNLKYRAGSASAYKWEFIGGSDLRAETGNGGAAHTTSATPYTTVAFSTPTFTVPLAGDYRIRGKLSGFSGAGGATLDFRAYGTFTLSPPSGLEGTWQSFDRANQGFTLASDYLFPGVSAGATASLVYGCAAASYAFTSWNRMLSVQPVRVG